MNLKDLDPGQRTLLIHHVKPAQLPATATSEQIENNRVRMVIFLVEKPRYQVLDKKGKTTVNLLERVSYPPHPYDRRYGFMQNALYEDADVSQESNAPVQMLPLGTTDSIELPPFLRKQLVLHLQSDPAYYNPKNPNERGKRITNTDKITGKLPEALIS